MGTPIANPRGMLNRFTFLGFVLALGIFALSSTARVTDSQAGKAPPVQIEQGDSTDRTVVVFIDSLSRDVAKNPAIMPVLGRLAREGASFDVEPCRDQLTYLCIRAALTGHDDSSLLAISDNFRPSHEGPPESLISELAGKGRKVSVIGASDFHPYRRSLSSQQPLSKQEESPEKVTSALRQALGSDAQLIVVALSSGDMAAHAHGVRAPEYKIAFSRLDRVVGNIVDLVEPRTNLVVFGDHGHDLAGRHLPGTEAKTWAVYRGPAFRSGVQSTMTITDHRALLGVLLGVPTEPTYRGPPLESVFDSEWVAQKLQGRLPRLETAHAKNGISLNQHWLPALIVALAGLLGAAFLAPSRTRRWFVALATSAAGLAATVGLSYDSIRNVIHDHGDSPERALWLLVPLFLGILLAFVVRHTPLLGKAATSSSWLRTAGGSTLLVAFLLMMPTAYYYGSRRGVVLAGVLGIGCLLVDSLRHKGSSIRRAVPSLLTLLFVGCMLVNFYSVRQLGPETGGASTWALDARLFTQSAWLALIASKLVLYLVLIAPRATSRPSDTALAAGLLSGSILVEFAGAQLRREAYLCIFVALAVGSLTVRHDVPSSLFAGALVLLDHLYAKDTARLAPIEMLLAGTAALVAWERSHKRSHGSKWVYGLSVSVAVYLMFWPTVGFHLAGLDFSFMFRWVPEASYEKAWLLIAFGVIVKLSLPIVLVIAVARDHLRDCDTRIIVASMLTAKVVLLSVVIAFFATSHSMASQQAIAMLSELVLVIFGTCTTLLAMPRVRRPDRARALTNGIPFPILALVTRHQNSLPPEKSNSVTSCDCGTSPPECSVT
jgi:hypothetical protein